jgi:3-deoxy-D-manno-octulosonic-acid transferase
MSSAPFLYRMAIRAARRSAPLLAWGGDKLSAGVQGRREAVSTLVRWGKGERDPGRPTAWVHAPSVGEALQAEAVVGALRTLRPGLQIAFTHFSPSAEGMGERLGADVAAYLPWDVDEQVVPALEAVAPNVLAFTKTEVWPVLVAEAGRRAVPVALVAATVPEGAGRMRWPARAVMASTWRRLSLACACSVEDAERLVSLGVAPGAVHVAGDPGIDSAARRVAEADPKSPWLAPLHGLDRPVVVAGSTWPADEAALLAAWPAITRSVAAPLLVVAPHEPALARVAALLDSLRGIGLAAVTLSTLERSGSAESVDAVVVDRLGILAQLYTVADAAYVGGGFGRSGLHSVIEPAAAGVPVVFGPRHANARAAGALIGLGAAREARNAAALGAILAGWLYDPVAKMHAVERCLDYIGARLGAAERTAALLDPLIGQEDQA